MAKKAKTDKGLMASVRKLTRDLMDLNKTSKELIDDATGSDTTLRDDQLDSFDNEIDSIISADFKKLTSTESGDLGSFLIDILKSDSNLDASGGKITSIEDLFESDAAGLFQQFQVSHQNELMTMQDIEMITGEFNELNEAVYVTRDSIFNSDDHSPTISREILFKGKSDSKDLETSRGVVEGIEEEYKLHTKLKDHIGPNTLKFGKYYVYVAPYDYIFERYSSKRNDANQFPVTESFTATLESVNEEFINKVLESGTSIDPKGKVTDAERKKALSYVNEMLSGIRIDNENNTIPVLENAHEVGAYFDHKQKQKKKENAVDNTSTDGVVDTSKKKDKKLDTDFSNINGVYMKLIDPRKVIPVRIWDTTIGYYYIHERVAAKTRNLFSSNFRIDLLKETTKKEQDFVRLLTERVVQSFNKPFLENNIQFKDSIATALQQCDIYNKDLQFQFIPKDHMVEFKVNENVDGEGTSMLQGSLFYAKLYLTLLKFNMITILSKSNDQRLYYMANSGIDKDVASGIQRVSRELKARQINHSDLFNYNTMLSKVGMGKDAFIPTGKGDIKALSFDTLAGQQVELYSELMNVLRTGAINNTGVPSVIMDYINQADYSRSIVMGNLRHLVRCISNQLSFNESTTELYRKILVFGKYMDIEDADTMSFVLSKPRAADGVNFVELLNNTNALSDFVANTLYGENSEMTDEDNISKDLTIKKVVREFTQMIDWVKFDAIKEASSIEAKAIISKKKEKEETQTA